MIFQRQFEGHAEQLSAILEFVVQTAAELGASADDIFACQLAADEAATNVFEHAYGGRAGRVDVSMKRASDSLVIVIRDRGAPFDPAMIPKPDLNAPLEERPLGGLGLFLIRHYMADVSFTFDPVAGNSITMRRKLSQREQQPT